LKVDDGVVVDDRLRTSVKNIYAVGDIARYPDKISGRLIRVEHWVHAQRQGQHVARAILGADMPFTDPPFFWTAHYDKALHYSGHAEDFSQPTIEGSIASGKAVARYEAEGKLTAVATLDQDLESLRSERALELQTQAQ
jgi:NADPH-dependent 2,4-dienoyl-CoA reductase/sulfur reductase-like enzyme